LPENALPNGSPLTPHATSDGLGAAVKRATPLLPGAALAQAPSGKRARAAAENTSRAAAGGALARSDSKLTRSRRVDRGRLTDDRPGASAAARIR
jgi:hypothetical protein